MPITKYQDYLDNGQLGLIATAENKNVKTRKAEEIIGFGKGVVTGAEPSIGVKNIAKNKAVLTFNADFVASNVINLKVNGVAINSVTFSSDQATTKGLLISSIDSLVDFKAEDAAGRDIIITSDNGQNITVDNIVVSGGASQATGSVTYESLDVFEGISVLRHGQPVTIGGDDSYQIDDALNLLTKGTIWVNAIATIAYGDAVYVSNDKTDPANQGNFTNDSTGNLLVSSARFVSSATGTTGNPALVLVEINQP